MDHSAGYWLQQAINGLSLAGFYVTLACAFALLQGVTNRIVLSFGDFAMFSSFAAVYAALAGLLQGAGVFAMIAVALLAAVASGAALGHVAARQVFQPVFGAANQSIMIASIGLSICLQEVMRLQSGAKDQWLPPVFGGQSIEILSGGFPVHIGFMQLSAFIAAVASVALLVRALHKSVPGRYWRATREDVKLASLCGLDTAKILRLTVVASAALAGIAGWNVTIAYGGVSFHMGLVLGFKAMFASVVGGFGRISGAIAGGLLLAALETLWAALFPLAYRDVAVFSLVIAILYLKPEGLMVRPLQSNV